MNIATIKHDFEAYFNRELEPCLDHFDNETAFYNYVKKALYFTKAVIEPLERKGMQRTDAIVDVAAGDGQLSFALALLGYRNITLFDLDRERLANGIKLIHCFCPDADIKWIHDSATNLNQQFDVLISYQTIEHLSDEGNYSVAKKHCQEAFLQRINRNVTKLCYINAPNRGYPIDGHDTGKPLMHYLPTWLRQKLIASGVVKCSWSGICRPVSVAFLNRNLPNFKLATNYYAFDSMRSYLENRPTFDYMGNPMPKVDTGNLPWTKVLLNRVSKLLGQEIQRVLPVLSVIYKVEHA